VTDGKKIIAQIMFFSYKGGVSIGLIQSKNFNHGEYGVEIFRPGASDIF
jgi:hypothetical protein